MIALVQWALTGGFWRFAGFLALACVAVQGFVAATLAVCDLVRALATPWHPERAPAIAFDRSRSYPHALQALTPSRALPVEPPTP